MKKVSICLAMALLVGVTIFPAYAEEMPDSQVETISTECGVFEVETTLVVQNSLLSSTRTAQKTQTVKSNGTVIAEVTLTASFGYDGSTVWVVSASGSHTTSGGWSYKNESIAESGGTAALTAELSKLLYPTYDVNISITCSPSGQIR